MRARAFVLAAVLLVGGACAGGGPEGVSSDRAPAGPSAGPAATIPPPGAVSNQAPAELPERDPAMPTDTVSLEELHRQGRPTSCANSSPTGRWQLPGVQSLRSAGHGGRRS